jgi:hypothetical protein
MDLALFSRGRTLPAATFALASVSNPEAAAAGSYARAGTYAS